MCGSKWVLGTFLGLALIAGNANAATQSAALASSGSHTVHAVITPGAGTVAVISAGDKGGMASDTVIWSVRFDPTTLGLYVNGQQIGMYDATMSYAVTVVASTVNGQLFIDTTVALAATGDNVATDVGNACNEGDANVVEVNAATITSLSTE